MDRVPGYDITEGQMSGAQESWFLRRPYYLVAWMIKNELLAGRGKTVSMAIALRTPTGTESR